MPLPIKAVIPEAYLIRNKEKRYTGPILVGEVYAWEPDLPHARELLVVVSFQGDWIFTRPIDGDNEVRNSVGRFREAVCPTMFKPQSPRRSQICEVPFPFTLK